MTLYVTDDLNHLVIRAQTAIFVGNIQADLISVKNIKYPLLQKSIEKLSAIAENYLYL